MAGPVTTFDVKTQGVDHLIDRLKGFEPEVYKVLQREIKDAADKVGSSARGLLPNDYVVRNWGAWGQGQYDYLGSWAKASVKPSMRTRRIGGQRYVMGLVRMTNPGAVKFALYGDRDNTILASYVNGIWGPTGPDIGPRALGPAWRMHADAAREDIQAAINRAAEKVT